MWNRDGRGEILLSFNEEDPSLLMFAGGSTRVSLHFACGETEFDLYDDMETQCVKLHVDHKGTPHIQTRKGKDAWAEMLTKT